MGLHKDFPKSPFDILDPSVRWFPADEDLRGSIADKLMPPLVPELREQVKAWRNSGYEGSSATSKQLLKWWFETDHLINLYGSASLEFHYFFAQREALETIIYLYDVKGVQDKFDLIRFDNHGNVSPSMFDETWRRFVVKMATGSGKTKVMSLVLAWSFFHKLYEPESQLARNFLVITPNIIVLDRIYKDFQGLRIFLEDPVLPNNGYEGKDWRSDFQLTLHLQDEVRITHPTGNIFLTNIHRVYAGNEAIPSADDEDTRDYFLGPRPVGKTNDSKIDLGIIVRDIDELVVLNDEAHHVHDPRMSWFKSIQDIDNSLKQKDKFLSLQVDLTATPKHNNGAIFVQTISDYPLVEAIYQDVVKHPVLPDGPSRAKLLEKSSSKFTEKYSDYLNLGVVEWRQTYQEHEKRGKKAVLFVMTDDTRNCDDVKDYLEGTYSDLTGAVMVIHTKNNGEISESASGKSKDDLELLRKQANDIDSWESPFKVIVSVMMLKEGWDVRNVTTIVGLRAYSAQSNILPEQTLGRGLRKMYSIDGYEQVSVIGTDAFMEFVESIQREGVILDRKPMGSGTNDTGPILIEVDNDNPRKDLDELDIEIPLMTPRIFREYKNLAELDIRNFGTERIKYVIYSEDELREIIFKDITTDEVTHTTALDTSGIADYRSVIGYFARVIMKEMRLVTGYDVIYGRVKQFISEELFDQPIDLENPNTMRNLSELGACRTIIDGFKKAINALTVRDRGDAEIRDYIKLRNTRPFQVKNQPYLVAKRSVFNRVIGDQGFELEFASFLDKCPGVKSFAKNFLAVGFKLDYVNANGEISNYIPDFIVKADNDDLWVLETKGREELDLPMKMQRLKQWCEDLNKSQSAVKYGFVYIPQDEFEKYAPKSFSAVVEGFKEYQ